MLIDTHVHLNDEQYAEDLTEVISRAREEALIACLSLVLIHRQLNVLWN